MNENDNFDVVVNVTLGVPQIDFKLCQIILTEF